MGRDTTGDLGEPHFEFGIAKQMPIDVHLELLKCSPVGEVSRQRVFRRRV